MATNEQLIEMVRQSSPGLAQQLEDIVAGKIIKRIYCKSKTCKGRLIGNVYQNGHVVDPDDSTADSGVSSTRQRFDGYLGVKCRCGNNSLVSKQEEGSIGGFTPSKSHLQQIWDNLQKTPARYKKTGNRTEVDGFIIEEVV